MYDCENLTEDCVEEMMMKLGNLDSLSIRYGKLLNERCMRLISQSVAPIRVLQLESCCHEVDEDAGFRHLTSMQDLETLKFKSCDGGWSLIGDTGDNHYLPKNNEKLKNLHFDWCRDLTGAGLMSMTKGLSSLKSLKLQQCRSLTSECLESAFKENSDMIQSLEVLDLSSKNIKSLKFLVNYHLVLLNTLILNDTGIEDDDIVNLTSSNLNYKKNLKALDLSGCADLTDRALTDGVSNLTNLEYLGLGAAGREETEMFSMSAVLSSVAAVKRMKKIHVSYDRTIDFTQRHEFYYEKLGHLIK